MRDGGIANMTDTGEALQEEDEPQDDLVLADLLDSSPSLPRFEEQQYLDEQQYPDGDVPVVESRSARVARDAANADPLAAWGAPPPTPESVDLDGSNRVYPPVAWGEPPSPAPPQSDDADPLNAWGTPPPVPVEPAEVGPRSWPQLVGLPASPARRRALAVLVAVVLVAGIVAVVLTWARQDRATPSPAVYAFKPATLDSGLVLSRTWRLAGRNGNRLIGLVRLTNAAPSPVTTSYDEVIPKSVAKTVGDLTFEPMFDSVVQDDPIVRYTVTDLAPGATMDLRYSADVPADGNDMGRLAGLANDQVEAERTRPTIPGEPRQVSATLQNLTVTPEAVSLLAGQTFPLRVAGEMSDGTSAPAGVLAGIAWSSADTRLATVDGNGVVLGRGPGRVVVQAQAGDIVRSVTVNVSVAPAQPGTTKGTKPPQDPQPFGTIPDEPPATPPPVTTTVPTTTIPPTSSSTVPPTTTTTRQPTTTTSTSSSSTTTSTTEPPTTTTTV
ncbi:MAG: Ig-like domain-containing protein [Acidimicrobiales bacterium]